MSQNTGICIQISICVCTIPFKQHGPQHRFWCIIIGCIKIMQQSWWIFPTQLQKTQFICKWSITDKIKYIISRCCVLYISQYRKKFPTTYKRPSPSNIGSNNCYTHNQQLQSKLITPQQIVLCLTILHREIKILGYALPLVSKQYITEEFRCLLGIREE